MSSTSDIVTLDSGTLITSGSRLSSKSKSILPEGMVMYDEKDVDILRTENAELS